MAAVLACGDGAIISHGAAATIWKFGNSQSGPIDITVPSRSKRSRSGIRVHFARTLDPEDVRRHGALPINEVSPYE